MGYGYGKFEFRAPIRVDKFIHGLNSTKRTSEVADMYRDRYPRFYCVPGTLDTMLHNNKKRPPVKAFNNNITGRVYGDHIYQLIDGSEVKLIVVGQKLYSQNTTTGALTELYDFGGVGEAYFAESQGVCFVTNGVKLVKVESGTTAYQVGITAPSGVTAQAKAGGSLDIGNWTLYACYARRVSGSNVLFSKGQLVGTIALTEGNQTLEITSFPNSSDGQVGNKVIFAAGPNDSSVYYLYHQTTNNTTTSFDISSTSGKATGSIYSTLAKDNDVPGALQYIQICNELLVGVIDNVAYYSLPETTIYDLERFDTTNQKYTLPFDCQGIFTMTDERGDEHLYFNTVGGLIKFPYGEFTEQYKLIGTRGFPMYFKYFRTVAAYGNLIMGVTPKTFGVFDGNRWYSNDFSRDVKAEFSALYSGASSNNSPCGIVVQKNDRVEYHLSYKDRTVSTGMNNRTLVLNLNEFKVYDKEDFIAPWEPWGIGANYFSIDSSNNLYRAQSHDTRSVTYKDRTDRDQDENIYIGDTITTQIVSGKIRSGTIIPKSDAITTIEQVRILAKYSNTFDIKIQSVERTTTASSATSTPGLSGSRFGIARFGVDRFTPSVEEYDRLRLSPPIKCYAFYVEILANTEDKKFQLLNCELYGYLTRGRLI